MTRSREAVSERTLELYALDALPRPDAAALERRLAENPALEARLAALRASNCEILASHPPARVAAEVYRRAGRRPRARRWPALLVAAPALAALALVVSPVVTQHAGAERVKGAGPHLVAVKVRAGQGERLGDGARVSPGDVIQLAYASAGFAYGVVVSIDGRGVVTLHWPEDPAWPPHLEPGKQVGLPHSFELDDAPGFERFILVAAQEPISVARVLEAARAAARLPDGGRGGHLDLPASWVQQSLELRKESSR